MSPARSVTCTQVSVKNIPVSLNIAQDSLKRPRLACLWLALNNGSGFACFGDFVMRSSKIRSYEPDRYINYTDFHYTPVNCYYFLCHKTKKRSNVKFNMSNKICF